LGGSGYDFGLRIAVDMAGNAYVTGETNSSDFPIQNAMQSAFAGGTYDAFVTKLNSSGNALSFSTYLGGSDQDVPYGIAVDGTASAYVVGDTYSADFPTYNALQGSRHGARDAFVTKLNAAGNALLYSTFLGGSNADLALGVALDSAGVAFVMGDAA